MRTPAAQHFFAAAAIGLFSWAQTLAGQTGCPADGDAGSLVGVVLDETRTLGLPGVEVSIRWAGDRVVVASGADGAFTACSLPAGAELIGVASFGGMSSGVLRFAVEAGQTYEHEFLIGMSDDDDETGRVLGTVVDAGTGEPVDGAVVGLAGAGGQALTNATGAFALNNVPAGETTIDVQHVAYGTRSASVNVRAGASTSLLVRIDPEPIELEPLDVVIEEVRLTNLETRGFYERKEWLEKAGLGHFLTVDQIERRGARYTTHVVADVPGTRLDCTQGLMSFDCEISFAGRSGLACMRADVFIDGVNVIQSDRASHHRLDELVRPYDIAGIEVYSGPASTPAEFSGASGGCGVVVIWTK
ncbi:MAG: carboxypeptidase regulatory-like domain-containing protein [Gemmatimonadota bacterium]|nr:carboxypeptidase regulatory-like domain-containing protein [Gemmatimonadota bacterium]